MFEIGTSLDDKKLQKQKLSRLRWLMVSLAFLATVLNYVHRLSFNYLSAAGDLRKLIPDDTFGYISTAFFIAYMLSNAVSGFIIDKLGTRIGYALCMAFWTTAGLLHAFVITPLQFGIVRFLLGVGEAGNWPAGLKLVSEWFPAEERSTASGIFNSGSALGAIIVPPLVAYLGVSFGWQATFIILAILGYLWLAIFWFVYYTPGHSAKTVRAKVIPPLKLFKTRFVSMFTLSKAFIDPVWYFVTFWIGRYLADVHHWDLKKIGWYAILPFLVADVGNILGGYFTQFIIKKGVPIPKGRKISVTLAALVMAGSLILAPFVITTPISALVIFSLAGFGYTAFTANALAFPADVVPKNAVASVYGLASMGAGLGGAVFQSLSGVILKSFSVTRGYVFGYNVLFVGFGISCLVGLMIILFVMGPLQKNEELESYARKNDLN